MKAEDRIKHNRKRARGVTMGTHANRKNYNQLSRFILDADWSGEKSEALPLFINLRNKLQTCCSNSLYRQYSSGTLDYVASHTCKHKVCSVCNMLRAKSLRRKYLKYFKKNEFIDYKTGEFGQRTDFDFMHLTLTVPHTTAGFRGKEFYADELMKEFNFMRKKSFWKSAVFAGEFGVEVTKNESGLHIHIHALLVVRKSPKSRNKLHRNILMAWNRQTVDLSIPAKQIDRDRSDAIRKNPLITSLDVEKLDARGATFIGLESLYKITSSGKKYYVNPANDEDFMAGVMECIKYHFEPAALDKSTGEMDWELLSELLPQIYRRPLYRKFGAWHGVKELNVNDAELDDEMMSDFAQTASDQVINPDTLQPATAEEYIFVMTHASGVHFKGDALRPTLRPKSKRTYIRDAIGVADALLFMINRSIEGRARARSIEEIAHELAA